MIFVNIVSLILFIYIKGYAVLQEKKIAVLIPCYNEELTIGNVISDFRKYLPSAEIYVYDNNSRDRTFSVASSMGVHVRKEPVQGKGAVVRRMFRDIDADYYVMVDGDSTYDAAIAPKMVSMASADNLDLVNGVRIESASNSYRSGHRFGNTLLTGTVRQIFGNRVKDMLSGYKVFSKRFVKSFPISESGFGIETELSIHALELEMPIGHVDGNYSGRPEGSQSKLNTYKDGFRILHLIIRLFKHERPFTFFACISVFLFFISFSMMIPIIEHYFKTHTVPRFPTVVISSSIATAAILSLFSGIILNTVTKGRRETKFLFYLNIKN